MKSIEVVAGIIFNEDRSQVLLAFRKPEQHQGDRWEFPGGKMESGESQAKALKRELFEELALSVQHSEHRHTQQHSYSDKQVCLHFWDVTKFSGTPTGCEGQQLQWVPIAQLANLRFPKANQVIVDELIRQENS